MIEDYIRYDQLIDNAMRNVIKEALKKIQKDGLPGHHHFLISFLTMYEGVELPASLIEKHPEEMTIVLQHQYEDLEITKDYFTVVLSFDGLKEKIVIPFAALTSFADPGVKFGLKFNILTDEAFSDSDEPTIKDESDSTKKEGKQKENAKCPQISTGKNVVDLKNFRKDK